MHIHLEDLKIEVGISSEVLTKHLLCIKYFRLIVKIGHVTLIGQVCVRHFNFSLQ